MRGGSYMHMHMHMHMYHMYEGFIHMLASRFVWRPVTAFLPMVLQPAGSVTEVRAVQFWKDLGKEGDGLG